MNRLQQNDMLKETDTNSIKQLLNNRFWLIIVG